jgi:hypothetical protein
VRRAAPAPASEQAATRRPPQRAAAVRARLAPQRARLVQDLGVPKVDLAAGTDADGGRQAVADAPAAALAALHQARAPPTPRTAMSARGPGAPCAPWARNLLVYGPVRAAVLIVQIVLYLVAPSGSYRRTRCCAG